MDTCLLRRLLHLLKVSVGFIDNPARLTVVPIHICLIIRPLNLNLPVLKLLQLRNLLQLSHSECDIGLKGIREEEIVLGNIGNLLPQHMKRIILNIPAVDPDHPRLHIVQTEKQIHQRGLAASGPSDNRERTALLHLHRQVGKHIRQRFFEAEGQILNLNLTLQLLQGRIRGNGIPDIRLLAENTFDSAQGSRSLREHVNAVSDRNHRPYQHINILIKGNKASDGNLSLHHQPAPVENRQHQTGADQDIKQRHNKCLKLHNLHILILIILVRRRECLNLLSLLNKGLNHPNARDTLLRLIRQIRERLLLRREPLPDRFAVFDTPDQNKQHRNHGNRGKSRVDIRHHLNQHHNCHNHRIKGTDDCRSRRHPDRIQIIGKMRHQIARLMLVVIPQRQL